MNLYTASYIALFLFTSTLLLEAKDTHNSQEQNGAKIFPYLPYEDYQISDGLAGKCEENALKVFVKPFEQKHHGDVTQADLNNLKKMAHECIENEQTFDKAIQQTKDKKLRGKLMRGKIANKCLKLIGYMQVLKIKKLLHVPTEGDDKVRELSAKLKRNIQLDHSAEKQPMMSYLSLNKARSKSTKEKNHKEAGDKGPKTDIKDQNDDKKGQQDDGKGQKEGTKGQHDNNKVKHNEQEQTKTKVDTTTGQGGQGGGQGLQTGGQGLQTGQSNNNNNENDQ